MKDRNIKAAKVIAAKAMAGLLAFSVGAVPIADTVVTAFAADTNTSTATSLSPGTSYYDADGTTHAWTKKTNSDGSITYTEKIVYSKDSDEYKKGFKNETWTYVAPTGDTSAAKSIEKTAAGADNRASETNKYINTGSFTQTDGTKVTTSGINGDVSTTTVKYTDGTRSVRKYDKATGTSVEKTTNADGSKQETKTNADGSSYTTATNEKGVTTKTVETKPSGMKTTTMYDSKGNVTGRKQTYDYQNLTFAGDGTATPNHKTVVGYDGNFKKTKAANKKYDNQTQKDILSNMDQWPKGVQKFQDNAKTKFAGDIQSTFEAFKSANPNVDTASLNNIMTAIIGQGNTAIDAGASSALAEISKGKVKVQKSKTDVKKQVKANNDAADATVSALGSISYPIIDGFVPYTIVISYESQYNDAMSRVSAAEQQINEISGQITETENQIQHWTDEYNDLSKKEQDLQKEVDELNSEIEQAKADAESAKTEKSRIEKQISDLQERIAAAQNGSSDEDTIKKQIEELQDQADRLENEARQKETEAGTLQNELDNKKAIYEAKKKGYEDKIAQYKSQMNDYVQKYESLKDEYDSLLEENKGLQDKINTVKNILDNYIFTMAPALDPNPDYYSDASAQEILDRLVKAQEYADKYQAAIDELKKSIEDVKNDSSLTDEQKQQQTAGYQTEIEKNQTKYGVYANAITKIKELTEKRTDAENKYAAAADGSAEKEGYKKLMVLYNQALINQSRIIDTETQKAEIESLTGQYIYAYAQLAAQRQQAAKEGLDTEALDKELETLNNGYIKDLKELSDTLASIVNSETTVENDIESATSKLENDITSDVTEEIKTFEKDLATLKDLIEKYNIRFRIYNTQTLSDSYTTLIENLQDQIDSIKEDGGETDDLEEELSQLKLEKEALDLKIKDLEKLKALIDQVVEKDKAGDTEGAKQLRSEYEDTRTNQQIEYNDIQIDGLKKALAETSSEAGDLLQKVQEATEEYNKLHNAYNDIAKQLGLSGDASEDDVKNAASDLVTTR